VSAPRTIDEREQWIAEDALEMHASTGLNIRLCRLCAELECDILFGKFGAHPPKGFINYGRSPLEDAKRQIRDVQQQRRLRRRGKRS
jgi:hypothetical protein